MITGDSKNILTVLIAFSDNAQLEQHMDNAVKILDRYVGAKNIETYISKGQREIDDFER